MARRADLPLHTASRTPEPRARLFVPASSPPRSPRGCSAHLGVRRAGVERAERRRADLWWTSPRQAAETGEMARTDPFWRAARGRPWINHEWLWGRAAWAGYDGREDLLAWLQLGMMAAFGLVAARLHIDSSWSAACAATSLPPATAHWYLDLRRHVATLFGVALLVAASSRAARPGCRRRCWATVEKHRPAVPVGLASRFAAPVGSRARISDWPWGAVPRADLRVGGPALRRTSTHGAVDLRRSVRGAGSGHAYAT